MGEYRFEVNDAALRESFLRSGVMSALEGLRDASPARWGRMTAAQMVEHLIWAFELSTGRAHSRCASPAADSLRLKSFLYPNRPTPLGFMNPALATGLPPLRHAALAKAKAALAKEIERVLDGASDPNRLHTHPIFGPMGYEEWHRTHYKHTHHHLLQFGLIGTAAEEAGRPRDGTGDDAKR